MFEFIIPSPWSMCEANSIRFFSISTYLFSSLLNFSFIYSKQFFTQHKHNWMLFHKDLLEDIYSVLLYTLNKRFLLLFPHLNSLFLEESYVMLPTDRLFCWKNFVKPKIFYTRISLCQTEYIILIPMHWE